MTLMMWVTYILGTMFLTSGIIYFTSATRYIQFQKARHIRFDKETAEWKEQEQAKSQVLLAAMGLSTGEPPEPITGLLWQDGFKEEPGDPEAETAGSFDGWNFNEAAMPLRDSEAPGVYIKGEPWVEKTQKLEEIGGRKQGEQWVNFVCTYWSERFEYETIVDDKMVYPSQSQATESAIRTAGHLGLDGHQYKIGNDYNIDDNLHRVILEWITEKEEPDDADAYVTESDIREFSHRSKKAGEKND